MLSQNILVSQAVEHRAYPISIGLSLFDCSSWVPKKNLVNL